MANSMTNIRMCAMISLLNFAKMSYFITVTSKGEKGGTRTWKCD